MYEIKAQCAGHRIQDTSTVAKAMADIRFAVLGFWFRVKT